MMIIFFFLIFILPVLISVAFLTLLERKILSIVGFRLGPNKVGFLGLLQPFGDAVKLGNKQYNSISNFSYFFYYISCFMVFLLSMMLWSCLGGVPHFVEFKVNFLVLMFVLSMVSVSVLISGWSTFGKYSLLGSLRGVSQLISYESSLYFCIFFFIFFMELFSFADFHFYFFSLFLILAPFCFYIWLSCVLCELNRSPFDFSEGESELVSGFNIDFGGSAFTLVFLGEYSNIIFFSVLTSILFFGVNIYFYFFLILIFIIWIRSVLPRFRYDKLMSLSWTFFIPFLTFYLISFFLFLYF